MTPRKLRELAGVSQVVVAARMGISLRLFRSLESFPTWAWTVHQLEQYASACGHKIKIIAVDGYGAEREIK